jgi:hypothetical protein
MLHALQPGAAGRVHCWANALGLGAAGGGLLVALQFGALDAPQRDLLGCHHLDGLPHRGAFHRRKNFTPLNNFFFFLEQINALRSLMFEPKPHALRLVYVRLLLILLECALTITTTLYLRTAFNNNCFEAPPDSKTVWTTFTSLHVVLSRVRLSQELLSKITVTIVICGWVHTVLAIGFLFVTSCFGEL